VFDKAGVFCVVCDFHFVMSLSGFWHRVNLSEFVATAPNPRFLKKERSVYSCEEIEKAGAFIFKFKFKSKFTLDFDFKFRFSLRFRKSVTIVKIFHKKSGTCKVPLL
jgi:hypothetical protein